MNFLVEKDIITAYRKIRIQYQEEYARITDVTKSTTRRSGPEEALLTIYLRLSHSQRSTVYKLYDGWEFAGLIGGNFIFYYFAFRLLSKTLSGDFALNLILRRVFYGLRVEDPYNSYKSKRS